MKEKAKKIAKKILNSRVKFGVIAIILIGIFCIAITPVTLQNDTFYTIKIGEHIDQYGVDMKDPFSWHEGLPYTYPHWLYDLITYYIYSAFGMDGIYVCTCILSVILGISLYIVNAKLTKNKVVSFFLTIGVMYLIRSYIAARAQLVTFILFVLTVFFIEKFLQTKKVRYAVPLIIIPVLIANLHVAVWPFYFVLFLPFIAEYLIAIFAQIVIYQKVQTFILKLRINLMEKTKRKEEKILKIKTKLKELEDKVDRVKIKREQNLQNPYKIKLTKNNAVKWLILIAIIASLTGLLTPLGDTPYTYLAKTMEGNTTQNINEHLPMTVSNETEIMCVFVVFLAILMFTKTKIRLCDLFMIAGLCYLMLSSRRQITMFALIGSVILGRLITALMEEYDKESTEKMLKTASKFIVVLVVSVGTLIFSYNMAKPKFNDEYIDESSYPVQACDYIIENIDLGKARFYNEYNYGSYMLFRGIPVFIDSRADLYSPEFNGKEDIFMDFINTSSIGQFYEDTFEKYGITHVICYSNSKMNMIIEKTQDSNYKELYKDDNFVVYERLNV